MNQLDDQTLIKTLRDQALNSAYIMPNIKECQLRHAALLNLANALDHHLTWLGTIEEQNINKLTQNQPTTQQIPNTTHQEIIRWLEQQACQCEPHMGYTCHIHTELQQKLNQIKNQQTSDKVTR